MQTVIDYIGLDYFADPSKRVYWLYLLTSALIAVIYLYNRPRRLLYAVSPKILWHKSARLDYLYFILSVAIKVAIIVPVVISSGDVARWIYTKMALNFGYVRVDFSYESVMILYTLSLFIVSDFTRYWLHRWLHTVKFLWRFHKVHHSARVLNPLTFYRVHPVENFLFGLRYALSSGVVTGVFIFVFGGILDTWDILGVNGFVVAFMAFGSNLRHSHIALKFYKPLEYIFISPAQHQIHHANKTMDKNYGGSLAIWDYIFGSLAFSKDTKIGRFGLRQSQMGDYDNILKLLFTPFRRQQ